MKTAQQWIDQLVTGLIEMDEPKVVEFHEFLASCEDAKLKAEIIRMIGEI